MKDSVTEMLEEALFDENKLVTYKWLSRNMELTVQEAKQKLEEFLENRKGEKGLNAVYYISGDYKKDNITRRKVSLVRDKDLDKAKSRLSTVYGCHVYSLQCIQLKDLGPVYAADMDDDSSADIILSDLSRCQIAPPVRSAPVINGYHVDKKEEVTNVEPAVTVSKPSASSVSNVGPSKKDSKQEEAKPSKKLDSKQGANNKQKSNDISKMFSAMGQKAAKRPTPESSGKEEKIKEGSKKTEEKEKRIPSSSKKAEKTTETGEKIEETDSQKKRSSTRKRRKHIDSSSSGDEIAESDKKSSSRSQSSSADSLKDIFASEVSSPEPSPVKSVSELRRSPRKHDASLSPPKKNDQKKGKKTSSSKKADKKSKSQKSTKKVECTPEEEEDHEQEEEEEEEENEVIPPTPLPVTKKVTTADTFMDDDGFMVVKKTAKTVTTESTGGGKLPPQKKRTSPRKSSSSPPKKKKKKESPKKQTSLTSFFKKN